jgi:hypothetical protein
MLLAFADWLIEPVAVNTATTAAESAPLGADRAEPLARPVARKIA